MIRHRKGDGDPTLAYTPSGGSRSLGLAGYGNTGGWWFQNMGMTRGPDDLTRKLLLTCLDVANPFIGQDVIEGCAFIDAHLQHAPDDIPALAWQKSQKSPGTLDDFLALAGRLG